MAVPWHRHQCFCLNHPQHLQGVWGSCLFSDQIREDLQLCRELRVPIWSYSIILLVTILGTPSLLEAAHSIMPCLGDVEQIHFSTFHQRLVEEKTMEGLHNLANSVILPYYIRSWRGFHCTFPHVFVTLCCKMAHCRHAHSAIGNGQSVLFIWSKPVGWHSWCFLRWSPQMLLTLFWAKVKSSLTSPNLSMIHCLSDFCSL